MHPLLQNSFGVFILLRVCGCLLSSTLRRPSWWCWTGERNLILVSFFFLEQLWLRPGARLLREELRVELGGAKL